MSGLRTRTVPLLLGICITGGTRIADMSVSVDSVQTADAYVDEQTEGSQGQATDRARSAGHSGAWMSGVMFNEIDPRERVAGTHLLDLQIPGAVGTDLRGFIRGKIHHAYPGIQVFGSYLDALIAGIEPIVRFAPDSSMTPFQIAIPDYLFADSLKLRMHVSLQEKMLRMYADTLLVVEEKVGVGDFWMDDMEKERDFTTRKGTFFINRVVRDPWWYPPKWAGEDKPVPPGLDNPLGAWMAELCRDSTRSGYGFEASRRATRMRLHGTHRPLNDTLSPTRGCVRVNNATQEELYSGLLRYSPHDSARVTPRGEIIPLRRPIRIDITE